MDFLKSAKQYVDRGWFVFPLHTVDDAGRCSCGNAECSDAGKHPRVARWRKDASRDLEKVEAWFGPNAPPSNIGVVTGEVSGITVLDVDIADGKLGAESWAEAIGDAGEPNTLVAQTGSGGMHFLFQYNSALKTASNVLGMGIDCRNDAGYIVAAPSRHRSGGRYSWVNWDEWAEKLAVLPAHLSRRKERRGRPRKDDVHRNKYTLQQVRSMLEVIEPSDRDFWRTVGIVLGREYERSEEAWEAYVVWSANWSGKKGRNHDEIMREAFYELSQKSSEKEVTVGSIVAAALKAGWSPKAGDVPLENFVFFGPGNNYIYRPTFSYWVAAAVDAAVSSINQGGKLIKPSEWLKSNQLATSLTSDPQIDSDYLKGYDCRNGEVMLTPGAALFNSYRKPTIELGDPRLADPFVRHVLKVFNKPGDADQFLDYMAHRVQKPWEKPRFAMLIAGGQGVGKDTAIEFCCPAIGSWNVANIDPSAFEASYNEYVASTLVRISEAANLQEMSKWAFNERTKVLIAGSPDVCMVNPKYGQKFVVRMYCGVIITTNNLASGIYIPPDDRRYDVIDAATMDEMGLMEDSARRDYFTELWDWYNAGGASHVAAFLHSRDISRWSAANGQRKTAAHGDVVAGGYVTDSWVEDILDELGSPSVLRADWVLSRAVAHGEKVQDVKRKMASALGRSGYVMYRNPETKDGRWLFDGRRRTVYARPGSGKVDFEVLRGEQF